jgi:hypothetical protein
MVMSCGLSSGAAVGCAEPGSEKMEDGKRIVKLHFDKEHAAAYLSAALIASQGALEIAFKKLAQLKGTDDLAWFEDLRAQAVTSSKGTVTEQIPVEVEAGALRFGFETLDLTFERIRGGLIKPE